MSKVEQYTKPHNNTLTIVKDFLSAHNVQAQALSSVGDWLAFSVPVLKASEMFNATFHIFRHELSGNTAIRTLTYSIPDVLKDHIELVHPMTRFVSNKWREICLRELISYAKLRLLEVEKEVALVCGKGYPDQLAGRKIRYCCNKLL